MRALILERNKKVGRRLGRFFACAGFQVEIAEDPAELTARAADGPELDLVATDAFDGELLVQILSEQPRARGLLWTAEPLKRALPYLQAMPRISNVCARKSFDATPREWELLMVARTLRYGGRPGFADYLDWGFAGFEERVRDTAHRDALVTKAMEFADRLGAPQRLREICGELAHELLMNAMFDAPVGPDGTAKYAADRKAELSLAAEEQPLFRLGSDGVRVVMQVSDDFGRLERHHVVSGLARGLAGGTMDTSYGGAGLGMLVCHNATVAMFYHVVPGKHTEVTGILDLDLNLRELRTQARSLHYFAD